jgi:hypothetical protein
MPAVKAPVQPATKEYKVGNGLRGFVVGSFVSSDEAWEWLSERFYISYPGPRKVWMAVQDINQFGFMQWLVCKEAWTAEPTHTINELLDKGFKWE